jgi:hypothetical protein
VRGCCRVIILKQFGGLDSPGKAWPAAVKLYQGRLIT